MGYSVQCNLSICGRGFWRFQGAILGCLQPVLVVCFSTPSWQWVRCCDHASFASFFLLPPATTICTILLGPPLPVSRCVGAGRWQPYGQLQGHLAVMVSQRPAHSAAALPQSVAQIP